MTPQQAWDAAFALQTSPSAPDCRVRAADGRSARLAVERFTGRATASDEALLARAEGPVLDVGCGPGRLVAALARRGVAALGVDESPQAVRLTRMRGAAALRRSVFAPLPGTGAWRTVLLADGNIGIGGAPVGLLRRARELLAPGGHVLVELGPPGQSRTAARVRLEVAGGLSDWFDWGRVGADAIGPVASAAGLAVVERFGCAGRRFACLV